jgi:3-oxoacyl-(acyl-carrier-protein) synthase
MSSPPYVPPHPLGLRLVVTGLGILTPLAVGAAATWRRLLAGHSGIAAATVFPPRRRTRPDYSSRSTRALITPAVLFSAPSLSKELLI